jgi:hypothetical protein
MASALSPHKKRKPTSIVLDMHTLINGGKGISYSTANQNVTDIFSAFTIWQSCSDITFAKLTYDTSSIFVIPSGNTAVLATADSICEKASNYGSNRVDRKTSYVFVFSGGLTGLEHHKVLNTTKAEYQTRSNGSNAINSTGLRTNAAIATERAKAYYTRANITTTSFETISNARCKLHCEARSASRPKTDFFNVVS